MLYDMLDTIWADPLYKILATAILVELGIILVTVFWLILHTIRDRHRRHLEKKINNELSAKFFAALEDDKLIKQLADEAIQYPTEIIRSFIEPFITSTSGVYKTKVARLYRYLGLLEADIADSHSNLLHRRIKAMRRLAVIATDKEKKVILDRRNDRYPVRILASNAISHIGTAEELFMMLQDLILKSRLMEEPLYAVIHNLSIPKISELMSYWDRIVCPRIRRILLIASSRMVPEECIKWLRAASIDPSIEIRIGACNAAGELAGSNILPMLLFLAKDTEWQVRAQAVRVLKKWKEEQSYRALETALGDRSFWVRQNAATALSSMGKQGIEILKKTAYVGKDPFAADTARQELQRYILIRREGYTVQ